MRNHSWSLPSNPGNYGHKPKKGSKRKTSHKTKNVKKHIRKKAKKSKPGMRGSRRR